MRNTGRTVIAGEQPMKMVKIRAGTVKRMRELEVLKDDLRVAGEDGPNGHDEGSSIAAGEIMQGLYAYSQTEPYVPDPVIDVGFRSFLRCLELTYNNREKFRRTISVILTYTYPLCYHMELRISLVGFLLPAFFFVPEPDFFLLIIIVKGVAKIARKLGFDYAEAVVRAFYLVCLDVIADFEKMPWCSTLSLILLHRLDLNSRNAERFPKLKG